MPTRLFTTEKKTSTWRYSKPSPQVLTTAALINKQTAEH